MTRLLVIAPPLVPGGISTHVRCLAIGAVQRGTQVVVLSDGDAATLAGLPGLVWHGPGLGTRRGIRSVQEHIRDCEQTLLIHSPDTFHLAGLLADARNAGIGVHGTPRTNTDWLGGYRHTIAAAAIQSLPGLPILVPAELYRPGIAAEFSVGEDRVSALPNAIERLVDPAGPAGSERILVPVRLADDKLWVLDAAIELAASAARPLYVVGAGDRAEGWRERLERTCPVPWELTVDSDLTRHIADADVVVGAGLVAMEAAAAGRRVVVPAKSGGWSGVVTTSTLPRMRASNFVTWDTAEFTDPVAVWEQAAGLTRAELDTIAEAVRAECAPALMYDRLCALLRPPGGADPALVSMSVFELIAESERDQQKVHRDYATVAEAADYFRTQASNWEQAYRELEPDGSETARPEPGRSGGTPSSGPWRDRVARAGDRIYRSPSLLLHSAGALAYFAKKEAPTRLRARVPEKVRSTVRRNDSIPPVAWLGEYSDGRWDFVIGSQVETSEAGFYEGVWDGDFADLPPRNSEFAFGTGVLHDRRGPRFLSYRDPSLLIHVLRRVRDGHIFVSNSLVFALTAAEVPLDGTFLAGLRDTLRKTLQAYMAIGIYKAPTRLLADDQYCLDFVRFFDFHVSGHGVITRHWRRPRRFFTDFASYRAFVESTMQRLLANARDPQRRQPREPVVLLSRGYDSVATAVLARAAGLEEAGTLAVSVEGRYDDARTIAADLGLRCTTRPHLLGTDVAGLDVNAIGPLRDAALEFLTEGGVGLDLMMLPFQDRLTTAVMLTGNYGDTFFERGADPKPGFARFVFGGPPMGDFRLRTGAPLIAVPILGMRFPAPVIALNHSREMAPYSVGGQYDRPVLRRLGEEAGLRREDFGVAKTAVAPNLLNAADAYLEAVAAISERYRRWRE